MQMRACCPGSRVSRHTDLLSGIAGKIKEARENPLAAPVLKQAEALFGDLFTKLEEYAK